MAKSLGFKLNDDGEDKKEFIYDLRGDENMSDLYENINESVSNNIAIALGGYAILSKVYKDYLKVKFDKENFGPDLIGFKKVGLSMLKSKRINEDGTVDHPTKLIDILEKYDKQFYEKYKNKVIIACKGATTVNNQLFDPFYITVLIASTDNKMTPIDFKYIPIHPIAKKYQLYYIFTSYFNVILYCDNGNHCDEIISLINRKYPKAQEYNDKLTEYYNTHHIIKKIFNKKKPKKTDDKSTTNTKDKNKTSKETNVNESTLPSKERRKLDDDMFGIPSLRKYPLNDKSHVLAAIRMFNRVDRKHEKELAHNIITAMEKYKISTDIIGPKNRLQSYI